MKTFRRLMLAVGILGLALAPGQTQAQVKAQVKKFDKVTKVQSRVTKATEKFQITDRETSIVNFAVSKLGQRLGDGGCTRLVEAALSHAGCKAGDFSDPKNYVWGEKYSGIAKKLGRPGFKAGMIIQFEDCRFEKPDGTQFFEMPHHTAIFKSVKGNSVVLIHQNAPIGGPVVEQALDLSWLKAGRYTVFKALPN